MGDSGKQSNVSEKEGKGREKRQRVGEEYLYWLSQLTTPQKLVFH